MILVQRLRLQANLFVCGRLEVEVKISVLILNPKNKTQNSTDHIMCTVRMENQLEMGNSDDDRCEKFTQTMLPFELNCRVGRSESLGSSS